MENKKKFYSSFFYLISDKSDTEPLCVLYYESNMKLNVGDIITKGSIYNVNSEVQKRIDIDMKIIKKKTLIKEENDCILVYDEYFCLEFEDEKNIDN